MRILAMGLFALIAACQPLGPRSSAEKSLAPDLLSALGPRSGIVVAPTVGAGPEVAARLPGRVAEALRRREVPATARANPNRRFALFSEVRTEFGANDSAEVAVHWTLRDPRGAIMEDWDQSMSAGGAAWRQADPALIDAIAEHTAEQVEARIGTGELRSVTARPVSLAIMPISGAPGDGEQSLAVALEAVLRLRGVEVDAADRNVDFFVAGNITLERVVNGERIDIVWWLLRADGRDAGKVDQSNVLSAGSLDGPWGDTAYAIAEGAADGILDLLARPETAR